MQEVSQKLAEKGRERFESLFGFLPPPVRLVVDKKNLKPWEAAATWIGPSVHIQLKSEKPPLFYSIEEIISHELVHVVRAEYNEPLFEEILAFSTSNSRFRRFFGPLFSSPKESLFFLGSLFLSWGGCATGLFFDIEPLLFCWTLPIGVFCYLLIRLCYFQAVFKKALLYAERESGSKALGILILMTDAQIKAFGSRF
ncbi:MAG: hypothetical protein RLZZ453_762 [Chlamydiota bacterium]|jgi:hypothetical protein